ncbi:MAG: class I SAM-dependent methyltransferase [Rhizobium sp.]|nr:class I SAM-dependent methyltransferase [Rhizobium sp.]
MSNWHNESGRPLASDTWLEAHHRAKRPEREAFAKLIAQRNPRRIVDLGCGPALWLELLAGILPTDCELYGLDSDESALQLARSRSREWPQRAVFEQLDFETRPCVLPEADIFLAFNIFPYVSNPDAFLKAVRSKLRPGGCLVVRQYDGALLRMGPMRDEDRQLIDLSLMTSVLGSGQFKHYDLDRVFESIATSDYVSKSIDFEVFRRVAPYPPEFREYFLNMIGWTHGYISEEAKTRLKRWLEVRGHGTQDSRPSYFMEVDLVAWLS